MATSATNKTPLGLSQWIGSDKTRRSDFNSDNAIVDEELGRLNQSKANQTTGIWTPTIYSGAVSLSAIASSTYVRTGRVVELYFRGTLTVSNSSSSEVISIGGIPFQADGYGGAHPLFPAIFESAAADLGMPCVMVNSNDNAIQFVFRRSNGGTNASGANLRSGLSVWFHVSYLTSREE